MVLLAGQQDRKLRLRRMMESGFWAAWRKEQRCGKQRLLLVLVVVRVSGDAGAALRRPAWRHTLRLMSGPTRHNFQWRWLLPHQRLMHHRPCLLPS